MSAGREEFKPSRLTLADFFTLLLVLGSCTKYGDSFTELSMNTPFSSATQSDITSCWSNAVLSTHQHNVQLHRLHVLHNSSTHQQASAFVMAALWNRAGHYIFILWFLLLSSSSFFHRRISAVADWMSTILPHMVWPWCKFRMQVWNVLHVARWKYRMQKWRKKSSSKHHCTTLSGSISAKKARINNHKKNLLNSNTSPTCPPQYGELRPTNGWDQFRSLGYPSKFQRVSRLGSVTAWHSSDGRQPNCGVVQRASPIFGRAAITLGIGPHSSLM